MKTLKHLTLSLKKNSYQQGTGHFQMKKHLSHITQNLAWLAIVWMQNTYSRWKIDMSRKEELLRELSELMAKEPIQKFTTPADALSFLFKYRMKSVEHFLVVTLNANNEIIKTHVVSKGLVNRTLVHPREIFRPAIKDNATAIILSHNHPSGNLEPSRDDIQITDKLIEAGEILKIEILDHIIISKRGYYSFQEDGRL